MTVHYKYGAKSTVAETGDKIVSRSTRMNAFGRTGFNEKDVQWLSATNNSTPSMLFRRKVRPSTFSRSCDYKRNERVPIFQSDYAHAFIHDEMKLLYSTAAAATGEDRKLYNLNAPFLDCVVRPIQEPLRPRSYPFLYLHRKILRSSSIILKNTMLSTVGSRVSTSYTCLQP